MADHRRLYVGRAPNHSLMYGLTRMGHSRALIVREAEPRADVDLGLIAYA